MVENAVKHGLKSSIRPVEIGVSVGLDEAQLRLRVVSPGPLRADWRSAGAPGVGLSVLARRLALHYPQRHFFTLEQQGGQVIAELRLEGAPCFA